MAKGDRKPLPDELVREGDAFIRAARLVVPLNRPAPDPADSAAVHDFKMKEITFPESETFLHDAIVLDEIPACSDTDEVIAEPSQTDVEAAIMAMSMSQTLQHMATRLKHGLLPMHNRDAWNIQIRQVAKLFAVDPALRPKETVFGIFEHQCQDIEPTEEVLIESAALGVASGLCFSFPSMRDRLFKEKTLRLIPSAVRAWVGMRRGGPGIDLAFADLFAALGFGKFEETTIHQDLAKWRKSRRNKQD